MDHRTGESGSLKHDPAICRNLGRRPVFGPASEKLPAMGRTRERQQRERPRANPELFLVPANVGGSHRFVPSPEGPAVEKRLTSAEPPDGLTVPDLFERERRAGDRLSLCGLCHYDPNPRGGLAGRAPEASTSA